MCVCTVASVRCGTCNLCNRTDEYACPLLHPTDFEFACQFFESAQLKAVQKDRIDFYLEAREGSDEGRKPVESPEQEADIKFLGDFGVV